MDNSDSPETTASFQDAQDVHDDEALSEMVTDQPDITIDDIDARISALRREIDSLIDLRRSVWPDSATSQSSQSAALTPQPSTPALQSSTSATSGSKRKRISNNAKNDVTIHPADYVTPKVSKPPPFIVFGASIKA